MLLYYLYLFILFILVYTAFIYTIYNSFEDVCVRFIHIFEKIAIFIEKEIHCFYNVFDKPKSCL